jgi:Fe-S-cluster-containing hydrogenase component 2
MTQCPVGSIRRKESLEILIEDWCIGCSKCAELCPYGNINMHSLEVVRQENPAPAAVPPPSVPPKPAPQPPASLEATQAANPAAAPGAATVLKEPPKNAPVSAAVAKTAAPKKAGPKKVTVLKATTCDLCTQLTTPSCVYACPHDAAKRVEPTQFLATQIGTGGSIEKRRFNWLSRPSNRTTH